MAKESRNLVVGLDIGTSKVTALVAEIGSDGALEGLGMGNHESRGLKKGVVGNIEATVAGLRGLRRGGVVTIESRVAGIRRALGGAELMADCKIASAFPGIAGSHIR